MRGVPNKKKFRGWLRQSTTITWQGVPHHSSTVCYTPRHQVWVSDARHSDGESFIHEICGTAQRLTFGNQTRWRVWRVRSACQWQCFRKVEDEHNNLQANVTTGARAFSGNTSARASCAFSHSSKQRKIKTLACFEQHHFWRRSKRKKTTKRNVDDCVMKRRCRVKACWKNVFRSSVLVCLSFFKSSFGLPPCAHVCVTLAMVAASGTCPMWCHCSWIAVYVSTTLHCQWSWTNDVQTHISHDS